MSPHRGGLYYCRASLGIIDALSAVMGVISTYRDALMGFCLSVKRRVFAQPLISLTGHSQGHRHVHTFIYTQRTPTGTHLIYTCQHTTQRTLTGHLQGHARDTPLYIHTRDTSTITQSTPTGTPTHTHPSEP